MKFVDCNQSIIEGLNSKLFECKTERGMSANQQAIFGSQKAPKCFYLPTVCTRRVAKIPLWSDSPVGEETVFGKLSITKASSDRLFGHNHDRLFQVLAVQLVERHEHERSTLARCWW